VQCCVGGQNMAGTLHWRALHSCNLLHSVTAPCHRTTAHEHASHHHITATPLQHHVTALSQHHVTARATSQHHHSYGVACHALDPPRHTNNPFKDCTALFQPNKDHHYQALNVSLVFHNLEPSPLLPTPRILPLIKVRIHIDTSKLRSIMHDVLR
jgi:hypothetical protein